MKKNSSKNPDPHEAGAPPKCSLPVYNKIIEREGGDKFTCPNARCKCNTCEKKSCTWMKCSLEGVNKPCWFALRALVQDYTEKDIRRAKRRARKI